MQFNQEAQMQPNNPEPQFWKNVDALPEIIISRPGSRIQPIIEPLESVESPIIVICPAILKLMAALIDSEEWRISASEANLEEIYATKSQVVEVVHQYEEDVVVFDHQQTNPVQITLIIWTNLVFFHSNFIQQGSRC